MPQGRGSELLQYLADQRFAAGKRLPAIPEMAQELGISVGKLREQLEVARELGLVEVRPKTGIRALPFDFFHGVWTSLRYALSLDADRFDEFEALRNGVEASFFLEAVRILEPEDKAYLRQLVNRAWTRLQGDPIQIPHAEHRDLHLTVYRRLGNPFVRGLLEAYWQAYENVGLNLYADYSFLHEVWTYHDRMVEQVLGGDYEAARQTLVEHSELIHKRPKLARSRTAAQANDGRGPRRWAKQGVV